MSTAVISSTRNTPGSVATTDTRGSLPHGLGDDAHTRRVEERARTEVDDDVRGGGDARDRVLELGSARHVELALDAYHDAVVEPIDGNGEVRHIPHGSRV